MPIPSSGYDRPPVVQGNRVAGDDAVSGIVHVIRDEAELDKFREGEILVATEIPPHWNCLFDLARAIITETDALPAYVAEVANARSLPVITGVRGGTNDLRSGDIVTMHNDGSIERLQENRAPDSQMRVSVPAAVHARQFAGQVEPHANAIEGASVVALNVAGRSRPEQAENQSDDDEARNTG